MYDTMTTERRRTAHFGQMSETLRSLGVETSTDVVPRPA
jgi:hypothetical protein